jgi:sugar lactone lactonase YvrE
MLRVHRFHRRFVLGVAPAAALAVAAPAEARPQATKIVLPGASAAEGIALGAGSTFYAGDLLRGDIYRGDLQRGTVELFIDVPSGRWAAGMEVDRTGRLLFVAGGPTGQGYVYDLSTGATLAVYQFGGAGSFINDVTVTREGAWFTDSTRAQLYFVPISPTGTLGQFSTLTITGPAANTSGAFNLNGIAATPNGDTLIVAHSALGMLFTVDPTTGASAPIAGVSVPSVDGILLEAGRLWAVQNFSNQISVIRLSADLRSGTVEEMISSPLFQVPTAVARFGDRLAVVNAKFDTGFPPTASQYEVVVLNR